MGVVGAATAAERRRLTDTRSGGAGGVTAETARAGGATLRNEVAPKIAPAAAAAASRSAPRRRAEGAAFAGPCADRWPANAATGVTVPV